MSSTRDTPERQACRLQIFGHRGVGKSCFFTQMVHSQTFLTWPFIMSEQCQISHRVAGKDPDARQTFSISDCIHESVSTSVIDEAKKRLQTNCYHGIFLLYSVDSRASFNLLFTLYKQLGRAKRQHQKQSCSKNTEITLHQPTPTSKHNSHLQTHSSPPIFPISNLPTELQLSILRACLVAPTPILDMDTDTAGLNLNILLTCRLFFHEGRRLFLRHNTFMSSTHICLVGTKADLRNDDRKVLVEEGREMARVMGGDYFEVSNREGGDVGRVLDRMAEKAYGRMEEGAECCDCAMRESDDGNGR